MSIKNKVLFFKNKFSTKVFTNKLKDRGDFGGPVIIGTLGSNPWSRKIPYDTQGKSMHHNWAAL